MSMMKAGRRKNMGVNQQNAQIWWLHFVVINRDRKGNLIIISLHITMAQMRKVDVVVGKNKTTIMGHPMEKVRLRPFRME